MFLFEDIIQLPNFKIIMKPLDENTRKHDQNNYITVHVVKYYRGPAPLKQKIREWFECNASDENHECYRFHWSF